MQKSKRISKILRVLKGILFSFEIVSNKFSIFKTIFWASVKAFVNGFLHNLNEKNVKIHG